MSSGGSLIASVAHVFAAAKEIMRGKVHVYKHVTTCISLSPLPTPVRQIKLAAFISQVNTNYAQSFESVCECVSTCAGCGARVPGKAE